MANRIMIKHILWIIFILKRCNSLFLRDTHFKYFNFKDF